VNPLLEAVLRAGIISPAMLRELRRFNPGLAPGLEATEEPLELEHAARLVSDALQTEQFVLVRETDLSVVKQYVSSPQTGLLRVELDDGTSTEFAVTYAKTALGEYVFAWRGENLREAMTNGLTHLMSVETDVYFKDVRELFFGEQKAFMVCTSSVEEPHAIVQ
jgi:hypothetical protein